MEETYTVYVLRNPAGRFYIGLTEDLPRRVEQHNQGISTWTRHKGPWHLVWNRECASLSAARRLENELKSQKGGDGFYRLTGLSRVQRS